LFVAKFIALFRYVLRGPHHVTIGVCWRHMYLHCTETFSLLEMFQDDTLY